MVLRQTLRKRLQPFLICYALQPGRTLYARLLQVSGGFSWRCLKGICARWRELASQEESRVILHCCSICYNARMNTIEAIRRLNDIAFSQKGMFTTAQAEAAGVERYAVSRLEKLGNVERLAKGVYRMGGAPSQREEDVFAVWLSLEPKRRPGSLRIEEDPVAMGATAAWLYRIGEIGPTPYEFCMSTRKQTKRPNLILRKRTLKPSDISIASGIPATTPDRTVVDLVDFGEDLSLVSNVLNDAISQGLITDQDRLKAEIDERGLKNAPSDGGSLYERLRLGWKT